MADERSDYAILTTYLMREEAEVAAAALRAEGVDAFLSPGFHATYNWHYIIALGGLKVFVPFQRLEEARDIIRRRLTDAADKPDPEAEPTGRRDRWKVWAIIAGYFGLAGYSYWVSSQLSESVGPPSGNVSIHMDLFHIQTDAEFEAYLIEYCRMNYPTDTFTAARQDGAVRVIDCYDVLQSARH
jgi:hypothetical protein